MALQYQAGFGNEFSTEAIAGALPQGQNSPQKPPLGLYAEQLSGAAFTVPQKSQLRSWLYRILPSVKQGAFKPYKQFKKNADAASPNQLRWDPLPIPKKKTDLIDGVVTMAYGGDAHSWTGLGVHRYAITASMQKRFFYDADG